MAVLIAEGIHDEGLRQLEAHNLQTIVPTDIFDPDDVEAIIVRSVYEVGESVLRQFPRLKCVAKLGTGLDNIDQDACRRNGVAVLNAPAMNSVSTAEFTVMQVLNYYKNSYRIHESMQRKDYRRHLFYGHELSDLSAGVIGYGSVGKNIVSRLLPFVAKVFVCDRNQKAGPTGGNIVFVQDYRSFLGDVDVIILAVSLKNNEAMVNEAFLSLVRPDAFLVNPARGGLVDEAALYRFLVDHNKAFYYCDVFDREPEYDRSPDQQDYSHPLLPLSNVYFSPHIAGMTRECQQRIAVYIVQKLVSILNPEVMHVNG